MIQIEIDDYTCIPRDQRGRDVGIVTPIDSRDAQTSSLLARAFMLIISTT
jgi:hypothetical protein